MLLAVVALVSYSFIKQKQANLVANHISVSNDKYCDGWEDGYCEGWKDVKGQMAICPVTPICPIAEIDCPNGYKCGYNRGFKAGMKAAKDKN